MTTIRGERALWIEVLQRAMDDVRRRPVKGTRPNGENLCHWDRASALRFFFAETDSSLPHACEVLGLDLGCVRQRVQRILGGAR